jgi:hypothetical protein
MTGHNLAVIADRYSELSDGCSGRHPAARVNVTDLPTPSSQCAVTSHSSAGILAGIVCYSMAVIDNVRSLTIKGFPATLSERAFAAAQSIRVLPQPLTQRSAVLEFKLGG